MQNNEGWEQSKSGSIDTCFYFTWSNGSNKCYFNFVTSYYFYYEEFYFLICVIVYELMK
jgi:hypothetical protein